MSALTPTSLEEAIAFLSKDSDLRPVAGCTDLMVCEPIDRAAMNRVLDLLRIPELKGIRWEGEELSLGATSTFSEIRASQAVRESFPALAEAASWVGGWQIQNRATLGGNIANASPAGDSLPALLALRASVVLSGPQGHRTVSYDDFHTGYRKTALLDNEIITQVRLPRPAAGTQQRFRKVGTREAQAISKVVVALTARVEAGVIEDLTLAAGSVAAVPVRLSAAESAAIGKPLQLATAEAVAKAARQAVTPIDDVRSTAAYRSHVLGQVVRRMVLSLTA